MYFAKKKKKKGFTLIELLVVIAIIGILATIVIVNVNSARTKAKTATIIGSMDSLRTAAELAYDSTTPSSYASTCGATSANTFGATGDFSRINGVVQTNSGSGISCGSGGSTGSSVVAYAAWASTSPSGGEWYCVDSTGRALKLTSSPAAASTTCQ